MKNGREQLVGLIIPAISLVLFVAYSFGFIFWNLYLSHFGFFEFNFIQVRYLSAGLLFLLPLVILATALLAFARKSKTIPMYRFAIPLTMFVLASVGWFQYFAVYVFPEVPQYYGGALPVPTTIIGTPDQITYLQNFDIRPEENAGNKPSVQTESICLIYQNDEYAVFMSINPITSTSSFGFSTRVMSLQKNQFTGFQEVTPNSQSLCAFAPALYREVTVNLPITN